jgi:uncharacterized membrane protein YhaH (DUF805 family)
MEPINWFMQVVTQHYFDLRGRARRAEFWWYALAATVLLLPVYLVGFLVGLSAYAFYAYVLALFAPTLCAMVRRLQDTGRPAAYVYAYCAIGIAIGIVIGLAPLSTLAMALELVWFAIAVAMAYLLAQRGTVGPNAYGPDPKASAASAG